MGKYIIHQINLSNIGGVQKTYIDYIKYAVNHSKYLHRAFGFNDVDPEYGNVNSYNSMSGSFTSKIAFLNHLYSENSIVHFYNNIGSKKLKCILKYLPSNKVIVHERGRAWNVKSIEKSVYNFIVDKATLVLANSDACKILLQKKFGIDSKKIIRIHNGIYFPEIIARNDYLIKGSKEIKIGFIGRLDNHKGGNIFIKTAEILKQHKDIKFIMAGDGPLFNQLLQTGKDIKNLEFVGRVSNPFEFISNLDILVVPSIREPLGNVCIEAGFCRTPVIASMIDGIPEIIEDGVSGKLITPTKKINQINLSKGAAPLPEYVVHPKTRELVEPLEIDPEELAEVILETVANYKRARTFSDNLHEKVTRYFTVERYASELELIYDRVFGDA